MSQNWMRHFELRLTGDSGAGISLSAFRVTFDIEWNNSSEPRVATLKIYNLSRDTGNRILGHEFSQIKIIAGYNGIAPAVAASEVGVVHAVSAGEVGQTRGQNFGEIFNGEIRFTMTGRGGEQVSATDSYILIQAIDGHRAYNYAMVNSTQAGGYSSTDLHVLSMRTFNAYGVTQGATAALPATVYPRGRALLMPARDLMQSIADQCNATWQIVDGKVQMVGNDNYLYEAIVLNSNSGLIGKPMQTLGAGISCKCLINPNIRVNGLIELDQASVGRLSLEKKDLLNVPRDSEGNIVPSPAIAETRVNHNPAEPTGKYQPSGIATDGVYIVQSIKYSGDTRGTAWYMELMCKARGSAVLQLNTTLMDPPAKNG